MNIPSSRSSDLKMLLHPSLLALMKTTTTKLVLSKESLEKCLRLAKFLLSGANEEADSSTLQEDGSTLPTNGSMPKTKKKKKASSPNPEARTAGDSAVKDPLGGKREP